MDGDTGRAIARIRRRMFVEAPQRIGRFDIVRVLGEGGMGVVYEARDPVLGRAVAVKRVRAGDGSPAAQRRLLREARALARVVHPNVVAIYDSGTVEGDVYLAMELVEGPSLRAWLGTPRSPAAVLSCFVAIGEGLAAVHEAGVVHRDFKPDNVVVGSDRPRVLDFGLAQDRGARITTVDSVDAPAWSPGPSTKVTRTGVVMGTPAYMAPEQFRGSVDARSDQYAFCVALFEALAGCRPFSGATPSELVRAAQLGRIDWNGPARRIPARLRAALIRGLAPEPERRFPDMRAVVSAISRGRARGVATLALASLGVATVLLARPLAVGASCPEATRPRVEDPQVRAHAAAAFVAADPSAGGDRWLRVEAALDERVSDWSELWRETCDDGRAVTPSAARMACLERRRAELDALADRFLGADARTVRNGLRAVLALAPLDGCVGSERAPERDPATEQAMGDAIARAHSQLALGHFDEAVAESQLAWQRARDLGDPFAEADALVTLGEAQLRVGDPDAATTLEQALWLAHGLGYDERVAQAATRLIMVAGYDDRDPAAAEQWAALAAAALDQLRDEGELRAAYHENLGAALHVAGRWAEARGHYEAALEIGVRTVGRAHPNVAHAEGNLAVLDREEGHPRESLARLERVLVEQRALLGTHPDVAMILANLATTRLVLDEREAALADFEEALAIYEQTVGLEHPQPAKMLTNTAITLAALDRFDAALARHERAIVVVERVFGADHLEVARALHNHGHTLIRADRHSEARAPLERALVIRQSAATQDRMGLAATRRLLGQVALHDGDPTRAQRMFADAVEHYLAMSSPPAGDLAEARVGLAEAEQAIAAR